MGSGSALWKGQVVARKNVALRRNMAGLAARVDAIGSVRRWHLLGSDIISP